MTGQDVNGPGLSDGGAKNTLRGQADGNFVMQYDGIPFGDTNGPSHHSESDLPTASRLVRSTWTAAPAMPAIWARRLLAAR